MRKYIILTVLVLTCGIGFKPNHQDVDPLSLGNGICELAVLHELRKHGVVHELIVLAQSKLETGNYKSKLTKTHNNIFGFRTKKGYIKFASWRESVAYYKRWQDKHYKRHKHKTYYNFLTTIGYAEDPNYITKVKRITSELASRTTYEVPGRLYW